VITEPRESTYRPRKPTHVLVILLIILVPIFVGIAIYIRFNFVVFEDPYVSVDAIVDNPSQYLGKQIQVMGQYTPGSLTITPENVTFIIYGDTHSVLVLLDGGVEIPDFHDGMQIVVIGHLESISLFIAGDVITSLP
jgi:cytochrome c-type biogenesis protein CcmE